MIEMKNDHHLQRSIPKTARPSPVDKELVVLKFLAIIVFLFAYLSNCNDVFAQENLNKTYSTFEEAAAYVDQGEEDDLGYTPPLLSIMRNNDMMRERSVISFNRVWLEDDDGDRKPVWLARRRLAKRLTATTSYIDSRTCGDIESILQTAMQIERPRISLPEIPGSGSSQPEDLRDFMLDDQTYTLKAQATFPTDDVDAQLVMSGGSFSPLAAWARLAEAALAACWTSESPIPDRP